jgi:hypothetical protein
MLNTNTKGTTMHHEPTLADNLIEALKADIAKRGWSDTGNQYAYITGYLGSMLQSLADSSPKVRKEIEKTLQSVKARA